MSQSKVVLLTGGSSGIGLIAARQLAPKTKVVIASRSAPPSISNTSYVSLDLTSRASVTTLVDSWSHGPIDFLVLNAGYSSGFGEPVHTAEGIEVTFAANYLGHAHLVFLLASRGLLASTCRITFLASAMHDPKAPNAPYAPNWQGPELVALGTDKKLKSAGIQYSNAKLAVQFFTYALARHADVAGKHWVINAFEPGFIPTGTKLSRNVPAIIRYIMHGIAPLITPLLRRGGTVVSTALVSGAALASFAVGETFPEAKTSYILLSEERRSSEESYDETKQEELWEWTLDTVARDAEERKTFAAL